MTNSVKKYEEIVRHSFARSMAFGLERRQPPRPKIISKEELMERQAANEELISIAEPSEHALNGYCNEKGTFLALTDKDGCI